LTIDANLHVIAVRTTEGGAAVVSIANLDSDTEWSEYWWTCKFTGATWARA